MSKFHIGDKVYCPTLGTGIYTLDISLSGDDFIVRADISKYHYVNEDGRLFSSDLLPHIFHVTEENREKLESLYGLEFEKPEPRRKGSNLCRDLLAQGKNVLCYVSDTSDEDAIDDKHAVVITAYEDGSMYPFRTAIEGWKYAVPIDIDTLEPIEVDNINE